MKTIFLSLLFFCGVCISAFGQDLQSPQINQNAIFANPGLAGSKGCTRISTALSTIWSKYQIGSSWDNNGYLSKTIENKFIYNGIISIDGLIMKNKLGVGAYLTNQSQQINDRHNFYQNGVQYDTKYIKYHYTDFKMGFMLAPKLHLIANKHGKQDHVLSPALAIGFKNTQFRYAGPGFYNYNTKDSIVNGDVTNKFEFDCASLSLLYNSPQSYTGIKLNFKNYANTFVLYNVSFIYAKTYYNKHVKDSKFSFTHQFQLCIPTYGFWRQNWMYYSYFEKINTEHLANYFNANLDFRYGKLIFGTFVGLNAYATYAGITGGLQLDNTKIIINYSPKLSFDTYGRTGLFISANFMLQPKKSTYK